MTPRNILLIAGSLLLAFALALPAGAQTNAGLKGTVVDKDGAPLPGATVTVSNSTLGITQGAVTDVKGEFRIVPLPPGKGYTVKVAFSGMSTITLSDIEVTGGRLSTVQVTLRPSAEITETVRVTGKTDIVDTADTSTSTTFTSEFIDALPILGRNYQDILTLAPGVSDTDGDGNPNIHGARDTDVITLVDGVSTTDPYSGRTGQELNLDSIQEIEVKTSGASAEFGRAQGGFVNIVTKSGGNDFAGEFSFLMRSDLLDGDGAGIDDPHLHGGLGELGLRELTFNTFEPFVSFSGPLKKDKAWYYFTLEYRSIELPINAVTQAFVAGAEQYRVFGKATWEMSTNHKLQFSATLDPQEYYNLGLSSFTAIESGWTELYGGLNLILKETAVFSPNVFLETTVQHFSSNPELYPTTDPDTNGNGVLYVEQKVDGFYDARERDPGQDLDRDVDQDANPFPRWDVFEDRNGNNALDIGEDVDGDGRVTPSGRGPYTGGCEGLTREDVDCDGRLDRINEDFNSNGLKDPGEDIDGDNRLDQINEDRDGNGVLDYFDRNGNGVYDAGEPTEDTNLNGRLDGFNEDRNGNGILDPGEDYNGNGSLELGSYIEDRNFNQIMDDRVLPSIDDEIYHVALDGTRTRLDPFYPYEQFQPLSHDRDYTTDFRTLRTDGPYNETYDRSIGRITLREDLTLFIPEWHGQHDMKFGGVIEQEHFDQVSYVRPYVFDNLGPPTSTGLNPSVGVALPTQYGVPNEATAKTIGMYVNDTYKPLPNLTINLGVRFDRETTDSFGYTFFDPVAERELYNKLWNLGGGERRANDKLTGNNDGLLSQGFCDDPIFTSQFGGAVCDSWPFDTTFPIVDDFQELRQIAPGRLTQHHVATTLTAESLRTLFPEAVKPDPDHPGEEIIDRDLLRLLGAATFQEQEAFRLTNNNLAPRLYVSWDPWADSKTKLFAGWGRFYDKLFLQSVVQEEGPDTIYRYYRKDSGVTSAGLPTNGFGAPISLAPPSASQVDRGLQTPFVDEFTVGFERELVPEVSLRLTYIDRKFREQLQDTDINHSLRYDDNTGLPLDAIGAFLPPSGQSGGAAAQRIADNRPDLYIHNFFFNQVYRFGNINEARYKGIEMAVTKRLSRKWQMEGSYTYSRALGAAESFDSDLGDDPASVSTEFSYLDYDERHVVKLNLVTYLPRDWQVGGSVQWSSGLPYSLVSFFTAADNYDYTQIRRVFGYIPEPSENYPSNFKIVRRNTQRNNAYYLIDVRGEKAFVLGKLSSKFFLTVENLLNTDVLEIDTYEPSAPNRGGQLQLDAERNFGRRFQIGLSLDF